MKHIQLAIILSVTLLATGQFGDLTRESSSSVSRTRSRYMQQIISKQQQKQTRKRHKKCNLNTVLSCIEPTFQYTHGPNGTGIVSTDEQFEDLCFKMHDVMPYCVQRFMAKCATPFQKQMAELALIKPFKESTRVLCARDGPIRTAYLTHSACAISKVKLSPVYRGTCVRDIQAGFEYVESTYMSLMGERVSSFAQQFLTKHDFAGSSASAAADKVTGDLTSGYSSFCCVFNRWQNCFGSMLRQECGPGAAEAIIGFIHQSMMGLIEKICPVDKFAHDSKVCLDILPHTYERAPMGFRSHSLGSYFFSQICPNVGFGIIPERDF